MAVEIKIGVQETPREVVLDSDESAEAITAEIEAAITGGTVLRLVDDRGRTILVPGSKIAYAEIGASARGRVGFGS